MTLIKYRNGMPPAARFYRPAATRPMRAAETLNLVEAAALLGVSTKWLRAQVASGTVPGRRLGRKYFFSRAALNSWIASSAPDTGD